MNRRTFLKTTVSAALLPALPTMGETSPRWTRLKPGFEALQKPILLHEGLPTPAFAWAKNVKWSNHYTIHSNTIHLKMAVIYAEMIDNGVFYLDDNENTWIIANSSEYLDVELSYSIPYDCNVVSGKYYTHQNRVEH